MNVFLPSLPFFLLYALPHLDNNRCKPGVIVKKPSRTLLVNLNDSGFEANTFISSMQLSMWDNISGPRVEQVCYTPKKQKPFKKGLKCTIKMGKY